jgi:hypothetical protein
MERWNFTFESQWQGFNQARCPLLPVTPKNLECGTFSIRCPCTLCWPKQIRYGFTVYCAAGLFQGFCFPSPKPQLSYHEGTLEGLTKPKGITKSLSLLINHPFGSRSRIYIGAGPRLSVENSFQYFI